MADEETYQRSIQQMKEMASFYDRQAPKLNAALQAAGIGPAQLPASVKKRLSNVVDCAEHVGCEGDFTLDEYSFLFLLSVFQGSFWPVQCGIMLRPRMKQIKR
ncbi:unnamed protein product [Ixodes pacificus]